MKNLEFVLAKSCELYKKHKRCTSYSELKNYHLINSITSEDLNFFEFFASIPESNYSSSKKLRTYFFDNIFLKKVFSSFEVFYLFLSSYFLTDKFIFELVKRKLLKLCGTTVINKKIKKQINVLNSCIIYSSTFESSSLKNSINNLSEINNLDCLIFNPMDLIFMPYFMDSNDIINTLKIYIENMASKSKMIILDFDHYFFIPVLEVCFQILLKIDINVAITLKSNKVDSQESLKKIIKYNKLLKNENKQTINVRIDDSKLNDNSFFLEDTFTSDFNLCANLINILELFNLNQSSKLIIYTYNLFIISYILKNFNDLNNVIFEIRNKSILKLLKKQNITIMNVFKYSFSSNILMKNLICELKNNEVNFFYHKKFQNLSKDFEKSFNLSLKIVNRKNYDKNVNANNEVSFDFFKYESRKNRKIYMNGESFFDELQKFKASSEIVDLTSFDDRIQIIQEIVQIFHQKTWDIFATLRNFYDTYVPDFILLDIILNIIECLNFYTHSYKKLIEFLDWISINPIGSIYVDTTDLGFVEIASIIFANLISGNQVFLNNSLQCKLFMYIFDVYSTKKGLIKIKNDNTTNYVFTNFDNIKNIKNISKNISKMKFYKLKKHIIFIGSLLDFEMAVRDLKELSYYHKFDIYIIKNCIKKEVFKEFKNKIEINSINELLGIDSDSISIYSYFKNEIYFILKNFKINVNINCSPKFRFDNASSHKYNALINDFGSFELLYDLNNFIPLNLIGKKEYSPIVALFSSILSIDEIEFLYELNYIYNKKIDLDVQKEFYLKNIHKKDVILRINRYDELFSMCVIALNCYLLDSVCILSFNSDFFDFNTIKSLQNALKQEFIKDKSKKDFLLLVKFQNDNEFLDYISLDMNIRLIKDANICYLSKLEMIPIIGEPIFSSNVEQSKYISNFYIYKKDGFYI